MVTHLRLWAGLAAGLAAGLLANLPALAAGGGAEAWAARLKAPRPLAVSASFDASGRLWLARVENGQIWVSRADDGRQFGAAVPVNPEPEAVAADGENRPKLAVAADGTLHVSWTLALPRAYTGHIRYSRSLDGGRTFSPPITVNDDPAEISHRFDSLAVDGQRLVLAWLDGRDREAARRAGRDYAGVGLYYAVSLDGGATFSANRRFAEHSCECCRVALAWREGQPVALWRHVYPGDQRDFALAELGSDQPALRVSDDAWKLQGCPHHGGALAAGPGGRLHLAWYTQGAVRQGLFYRWLESGTLGEPVKFGNDDNQAGHPAVLAIGDRVFLAWREFDGKAYGVWSRRSPDGGRTWEPSRLILSSETAADYPQLLARGRQAWLVWNSEREGVRAQPLPEAGP